ncbi:hypothetical protein [Methanobrevibacter sp. V74]|uniref:hypothetical protein n=1 Tax=Methanobrevibacter sp. V74 TaxID=3064279 RepID=UPI002733B514|nr:hypothetical protein [Methanobrevibacter sp. V74]
MSQDIHDCVREETFINIEKRLTSNEEKVNTITTETTRLEKTLNKLDATQDKLAIEIAQLNSAFHTIKYLIGISIALFGTIFAFLITELIKII